MAEIVMIPLDHLNAHPDNPRKEIGDVSELAESIKAKGILQNLTVVPYFSKVQNRVMQGMYTVLIGHRRCEAARLAGLKEVPCTIVEMSYEDQIATMLVENMQRSDLTIYEEAKGFQMMLNLGKTIQDVSAMSGFSEATVRRRVKLAELDEKKFKKACERGATLFDFAELEKIEDPAVKDELLSKIGTKDWKNALTAALDAQKDKAMVEKWAEQVSQFATKLDKVDWSGGQRTGYSQRTGYIGEQTVEIDYVRNYNRWNGKGQEVKKPADADRTEYYFTQSKSEVDLYKKSKPDLEAERKRAEEQARRDAHAKLKGKFETMSARHRKLRLEFVQNFNQYQKKDVNVWEFVTEAMIFAQRNGGGYSNSERIVELAPMLGIPLDKSKNKLDYAAFLQEKMQHPERTALITAMWILDRFNYWEDKWDSDAGRYRIVYRGSDTLDMIYRLLSSLGYIQSTEEMELRGGTHKMFEKETEE